MLTSSDIMAGKILVQLSLAAAEAVRAELRKLDGSQKTDVVSCLASAGTIDAQAAERVRRLVKLYEHARDEGGYLRLIPRVAPIPVNVAEIVLDLEKKGSQRPIGEVLVEGDYLTEDQHRTLLARRDEGRIQDDAKIIERYRHEDFTGISKPLLPGSRLEPQDFLVSKLFRKEVAAASLGGAQAAASRHPVPAAGRPTPPPPAPLPPLPAPPPPVRPKTSAGMPAASAPKLSIDDVKNLKRIADYTIVEVLGVGGMGAVFLGQKDGHSIYAAIKVMLNQAATAQEKGRFRREIALTKRIKHKNVIEILDSGDTPDGLTYLVVPALVAKELRAHIDACGGKGLPPATACGLFESILEGMQAIHQARIIHRDMKPENVMVLSGPGNQVKIMDLGLARLEGEPDPEDEDANFRTMGGEVVGSPMYIAPESISREPLDQRTDIYSLGIMFFEMLTGKRPIESETAQGYLTQHLIADPPLLREVSPDRTWPTEADDLIQRMMAKSKDERFSDCGEILDVLRGGLSQDIVKGAGGAPPAPVAAPAIVAVAPPVTQKLEKTAWGVKGILGRLMSKGR